LALPQQPAMVDFNDVLDVIETVLIWISVAGALLTIITFAVFSDLRTYPIKLIMFLCTCIVIGYSFFWAAFQDQIIQGWGCWTFAIVFHYFFLANFGWCFCIAFNFFQMIVRRNREAERLEQWYHLGCWGIPLVICAFIAGFRDYGRINNAVCYITNDWARFGGFFLPGLISVAADAILFFFIGREIHETLAGAPKPDKREKRKELRVYFSIFISIGLTWIFLFIMFLVPAITVLLDIMRVLIAVTVPLQGILIFVSYCLNAKVLARWAGVFGICLPFCRDWEQRATSTTSSRF